MDYEEKYKEALERARQIQNTPYTAHWDVMKEVVEDIFPELAESEDERIRKHLIGVVELYYGYTDEQEKKDCLAWLEKQGEQSLDKVAKEVTKDKGTAISFLKSCGIMNDNGELAEEYRTEQGEQKPTDKVEPKFKVGDWVIDKQDIVHQIANVIENVTYHTYGYDIVGGGYFNDNTEGVRLWTIQDAKDGDVLVSNQITILFKKFEEDSDCNFVIAYAGIDISGKLQITDGHWLISNDTKPATSKQCDLLFQKMKEVGYEWDAERKELRKIEQKSAWSEEDEKVLDNILYILNQLKDTTPHKEDETAKECIDKLKSLKDRYTWKPSDRQMNVLEYYMHTLACNEHKEILFGLYQDLKKLKD